MATLYKDGHSIEVADDSVEYMVTQGWSEPSNEFDHCNRCGKPTRPKDGSKGAGDQHEAPNGELVCGDCYNKEMTPGPGHPVYEADMAKNGVRFVNG